MRRRVDLRGVRQDTVGSVVGSVAMLGVVTRLIVMIDVVMVDVVMVSAVIGVAVFIGTVPEIRMGVGRAGDAPVFRSQVRMDVRVRKGQPRCRHRGEQREQGRDDAILTDTDHE